MDEAMERESKWGQAALGWSQAEQLLYRRFNAPKDNGL